LTSTPASSRRSRARSTSHSTVGISRESPAAG